MQKGNLTRAQAVALVGEAAVIAAESDPAEYTNRVGYNGSCQGDPLVEFASSAGARDVDGRPCTVLVYYYQQAAAANAEDLGALDWTPAGYEIA